MALIIPSLKVRFQVENLVGYDNHISDTFPQKDFLKNITNTSERFMPSFQRIMQWVV